jgi:hypothetical protein
MGKERARLRADHVVFSFHFIPFVKGDSHPELCTQRTDEGRIFLYYVVWREEGGAENGGPQRGP